MGERGAGTAARGVEGFPMSDLLQGRSAQLDRVLSDLLRQAPEVEAASVVSFDGLPMASALPAAMDENRVAAMSAALLSLGERAAEGLGRGELSQVYVEGESGTVFLVSAEDEAVLVAVGARGAKVGLLLYEIRRAAAAVGAALRADDALEAQAPGASEGSEAQIVLSSPVDVPNEVVAEVPVSEVVTEESDDVVVDEADPLGLDSEPVSEAVSIDVEDSQNAPTESDDRESSTNGQPQPTPDLGAWATFSPGSSSSSSNDSGSWS